MHLIITTIHADVEKWSIVQDLKKEHKFSISTYSIAHP